MLHWVPGAETALIQHRNQNSAQDKVYMTYGVCLSYFDTIVSYNDRSEVRRAFAPFGRLRGPTLGAPRAAMVRSVLI